MPVHLIPVIRSRNFEGIGGHRGGPGPTPVRTIRLQSPYPMEVAALPIRCQNRESPMAGESCWSVVAPFDARAQSGAPRS